MNENGADIVLKCGFQSVNFKTVFSNNKGENLAKSGHVINVTEVIASYNGYNSECNQTDFCINATMESQTRSMFDYKCTIVVLLKFTR